MLQGLEVYRSLGTGHLCCLWCCQSWRSLSTSWDWIVISPELLIAGLGHLFLVDLSMLPFVESVQIHLGVPQLYSCTVHGQTPLASFSLQNIIQSGYINVICRLSDFHHGCPAYLQNLVTFTESHRIIYQQICCHSQDEDEARRLRFFCLWTYCVGQLTVWTSARRLSSYISSTAEVISFN